MAKQTKYNAECGEAVNGSEKSVRRGKGCLFHRDENGNPIYVPYDTIRTIDISFKTGATLVMTSSGNIIVCETFDEAVESYQRTSDRFKNGDLSDKGRFVGMGCVFHRAQNGNGIMVPSGDIVSIDISYHDESTLVCTKYGNIQVDETFEEASEIFDAVTA
ncbi:MAG: hypothetical protein MJZ81_11420 [Bacteroidales bacterium]|nr:hypothetical protein [Bacteroidales bacterium]